MSYRQKSLRSRIAESAVITLIHELCDFEAPMILLGGPRLSSSNTLWKEVLDRFGDPGRVGAMAYAEQAHPESDLAVLRQDAVAAVADFIEALNPDPFL